MAKDSKLLNKIKENFEEVLTEEDILNFEKSKTPLKHYIGFEVSGLVHLGTGLVSMQKVAVLQKLGVDCTVFLADWHAWLNEKLTGEKDTITKVAAEYFEHAMRTSLTAAGGDPDKVNFLLGSDLYNENNKYWETVADVSKHVTLARIKRSIDITGKKAGSDVTFARLLYVPMQVADVFIQGMNIAHAGTDQRKAHVVARQVATKLTISPIKDGKGNVIKPVALHHHLILGPNTPPEWPVPEGKLKETKVAMKMSKSKPETCIFVHDTEDEIREKVKKAFCPPEDVEFNPLIDWVEHLIIPIQGKVVIERKEASTIESTDSDEIKEMYKKGGIHPMDLKAMVTDQLIAILEPARKHFEPKDMQDAIANVAKLQQKN